MKPFRKVKPKTRPTPSKRSVSFCIIQGVGWDITLTLTFSLSSKPLLLLDKLQYLLD